MAGFVFADIVTIKMDKNFIQKVAEEVIHDEFGNVLTTDDQSMLAEKIAIKLGDGDERNSTKPYIGDICPIYNDPVLPDENGNCPLCGAHRA